MIAQMRWPHQRRKVTKGLGKCLGATYEGVTARVNEMTSLEKDICKTINDEITRVTDGRFLWTSLQINVDSYSTPHADTNNTGLSLITLLGHFDGGTIHMTDGSATGSQTGVIMAIDVTKLHYSDPFNGKRVSIVAFQHSKAAELSNADKDSLIALGFYSPLFRHAPPSSEHVSAPQRAAPDQPVRPSVTDRHTMDGSANGHGAPEDGENKHMCAPAHQKVDRVIIEICTSSSRRLGQECQESRGCLVVPIEIYDQKTMDAGVLEAAQALRLHSKLPKLIWVSIPRAADVIVSAGGCKHDTHVSIVGLMIAAIPMIQSHAAGTDLAVEWPRQNSLWKRADYFKLQTGLSLVPTCYDSCMYHKGFASVGASVPKLGWRLDTNRNTGKKFSLEVHM